MRTYPYMDGDRLIELVERRELDKLQAEVRTLELALHDAHNRLQDAAKRMEEVTQTELQRVWANAHRTRLAPCIEAVRTRLIQAALSADNLRTRETPDYGEPWKVGRIDRPMEDRHKHDPLMLHRTTSRAVSCVNACQGMADPAAEIQAMREAIMEAGNALIKASHVHHAITTYAQDQSEIDKAANREHCEMLEAALAKLKPCLTQES